MLIQILLRSPILAGRRQPRHARPGAVRMLLYQRAMVVASYNVEHCRRSGPGPISI